MSGPRPVKDFLRQILKTTGVDKSRGAFAAALDELLPGPQRELCQILGYRDGKLTVQVDSAPLYAELSGFRREELRVRINELVPDKLVGQLQFRMGGTGHA